MMEGDGDDDSSRNPIQSSQFKIEGDSFVDDDGAKSLSSVKGKLSSSLFQKRHNDNFPYEPIPIEKKDLISTDGILSTDELCKVEAVIQVTNSQNQKEVYTIPEDDPEARAERVKKFLASAETHSRNHENYDSFDVALTEDEQITCVLDCSYISGMPSQTTDSHTVMGKIKIALVESEKYGSRLLFSVAEGSLDISIQDSFLESQVLKSCICCCVKVKQPNGKYLTSDVHSTLDVNYEQSRLFTSQFFSMPLEPCYVDAMCYRTSAEEFAATASTTDDTPHSKSCSGDCSELECGCNEDCCCFCTRQFSCPLICGISDVRGSQSVSFEATAHYDIVQKEPPPLVEAITETVDGVQMQITALSSDRVYVVLHYRSLLDNANHTCKVQLESSNNLSDSYANAKKFIARAGLLSKKEAAEYFGIHPPRRVNDPVARAKRFDRSRPIDQQQDSSAFAAFAATGGASIFGVSLTNCFSGMLSPPSVSGSIGSSKSSLQGRLLKCFYGCCCRPCLVSMCPTCACCF